MAQQESLKWKFRNRLAEQASTGIPQWGRVPLGTYMDLACSLKKLYMLSISGLTQIRRKTGRECF